MSKDKFYYKDGNILDYWDNNKILHRENGPAAKYYNGDKAWCVNGKRHRIDGPAVKYANGYKSWWINGKRHRIDGPAVKYSNGGKEWFIDDEWLTEKEFNNHPKVLKYKYEQQFYKELEERL